MSAADATSEIWRPRIRTRALHAEAGVWTYSECRPHPRLAALLSRPWYVGCAYDVRFERWLEPPVPALTIIISLDEPLHSVRGKLPLAWIAGLDERPELVQTGGRRELIDLKLTPLGARLLCGRPLKELRGEIVALEDVLGPGALELAERMRAQDGWVGRFALLDRFLMARLAVAARLPPAHVGHAWAGLRASAGKVPIGTLAAQLGCSRRHLSASVHEELGLPPKTLARLLRFASVMERIRAEPVRWAEIAYECGYSDQPHLGRDFRELAGTSPGDFLARQLPHVGTVGDGVTFVQDRSPQRP